MTHEDYFNQINLQLENKAIATAQQVKTDGVDDLSEKELRELVRYLSNQVIRLKTEVSNLRR